MATCPDSDNSWVLASSENLPVETLGPKSRMDLKSEEAPQPPQDPSRADEVLSGTLDGEGTLFQKESTQNESALLPEEETKAKVSADGCDPEPPGDSVIQEGFQEAPTVTSLGPDTQGLEDETSPQNLPSSPKAVWTRKEGCSSSEDDTDVDVEGLRRRRGRDPSPPQPVAPTDMEDQPRDEGEGGELGISLNMCLLGALVLLGLGILLFSGRMEEAEMQVFSDTGLETELVDAMDNSQASVPLDGVPSLQNMGLLLDKLAKENQDIRLLQAQLQAQKEELQSLMHQPKGLEAENAQLRGALRQGEASQRALESELQQLRARLQGLEAGCVRGPDGVCLKWDRGPQGGQATKQQGGRGQEPDSGGFLEQQKRLEAEAQVLRQELQRQRQLLESVQHDLQRGLRAVSKGLPTHAGLAELGHRLAQTLQGLESWGEDRGAPANASEAWYGKPHFQNHQERSGKEKWRDGQKDRKHKREESGWERKKSWGDAQDSKLAGRWEESKPRVEEWQSRRDGKRQDPGVPPRKSGSSHSGERQKPPSPPWEELLSRKYGAPQGCSGVDECARQEGLAPVQRQELASLLRTYLARLPWAGLLTKELPLSSTYFGEDGVFRHDRLRFRDFVDALEDSLEKVAVRQTGDDDEVDDFEDFIFRHFFGDKALKRSGKKDKYSRSPRVVGPREDHRHHSHHG